MIRLKISKNHRLFVISAPSGCGKTSLINKALEVLKDLKLSISHTTRPPRPMETDGRDYYFVDENTFQKMISQDDFLEYATVFGKYYGTSRLFIETELAQGRSIILEIDWQGARQIRTNCNNTFSIFILPPSLQALQERLEKRAQDSQGVIASRMKQAISEARHFNEYNYVVVNDDFERASTEFIKVLAGNISVNEIEASRKLTNKAINTLGLGDNKINNE